MTYDLNTQSNIQLSTTSPGIFETNQQEMQKSFLESYKLNSTMIIFSVILHFLRILSLVLFIDIILNSKKYKSIYDSEAKKIIVIINLVLAYLQIIIIIYYLYILQKFYSQLKKYNNIIIIFLFFFVVYIISVFHLTHVLVNFDEYKYENICFLTHYFNFCQIISVIWAFIFIFYLLQLQNKQLQK